MLYYFLLCYPFPHYLIIHQIIAYLIKESVIDNDIILVSHYSKIYMRVADMHVLCLIINLGSHVHTSVF